MDTQGFGCSDYLPEWKFRILRFKQIFDIYILDNIGEITAPFDNPMLALNHSHSVLLIKHFASLLSKKFCMKSGDNLVEVSECIQKDINEIME
jgi:hypothetical protein